MDLSKAEVDFLISLEPGFLCFNYLTGSADPRYIKEVPRLAQKLHKLKLVRLNKGLLYNFVVLTDAGFDFLHKTRAITDYVKNYVPKQNSATCHLVLTHNSIRVVSSKGVMLVIYDDGRIGFPPHVDIKEAALAFRSALVNVQESLGRTISREVIRNALAPIAAAAKLADQYNCSDDEPIPMDSGLTVGHLRRLAEIETVLNQDLGDEE